MTQQMAVTARRAKTRARLLDAARAVIAERGAGGATVEAVSERAGFTRGAFYSNYASMADLVSDLVQEVGAGRLAAMQEAAARVRGLGADDFAGVATAALEVFVGLQPHDVDDTLLLAELELFAIRTPEVRATYTAVTEQTLSTAMDIIETVLEPMGRRLSTSRRFTAEMIAGYFDHVLRLGHASGQPAGPERLASGLVDLLTVITEPKES